jgi:hypothetical protein
LTDGFAARVVLISVAANSSSREEKNYPKKMRANIMVCDQDSMGNRLVDNCNIKDGNFNEHNLICIHILYNTHKYQTGVITTLKCIEIPRSYKKFGKQFCVVGILDEILYT